MLSPKTQTNLVNAKIYFREHLALSNYYTQNAQGCWVGLGAERLGLAGDVQSEAFVSLCDNLHPSTQERLTQRMNDAGRRVFYDFVFSPPKSVSIAALVMDDPRIREAHDTAVKIALGELESFSETRVRIGGAMKDRITGNIVAALFQHQTSRALDPHLHTHCIIFNATFDEHEQRWKALQNHQILKSQKFVDGVYYHELARALTDFGYTVVNSARGDFEIAEIDRTLCERFSKRHREINEWTQRLLEGSPELEGRNTKDIREHVAHKSRSTKSETPITHIKAIWHSELSEDERQGLKIPESANRQSRQADVSAAVDWAEAHLFERRSYVQEHEIWRYALERMRGSDVSIEQLKTETAGRSHYIRNAEHLITRRDVLACEWAVVEMARKGRLTWSPFAPAKLLEDANVSEEQGKALAFIIGSKDFITLFRGGAGTGKSYLLRRVQKVLTRAGVHSFILAPQRQQVVDLEKDGFSNTMTIAEFLQRKPLSQGEAIIVDEAGQIGTNQMRQLLEYAQDNECRVILSGDTRQHGPVECGDALRAIEIYSGCRIAELETIRRQDPELATDTKEAERISNYRNAVKAAANGDVFGSLKLLDQMGAVLECTGDNLATQLTESYLRHIKSGQSALVVSQTWDEIQKVNEAIRAGLKREGNLGKKEHLIQALERVDLTVAQKLDARYYPEAAVLTMNRDAAGLKAGDTAKLIHMTPGGPLIECKGRVKVLAPHKVDAMTVCKVRPLPVSAGDRLQLKMNAKSADGLHRLANGEVVVVQSVCADGQITLSDGRVLPKGYRHFVHGYAVTSYGSQGKTVDHVIFADSAVQAATDAKQWYVTVSRGRRSVEIFTTSKEALRANILSEGDRELAMEAFPEQPELRAKKFKIPMLHRGMKLGREMVLALCYAAVRPFTATVKNTQSQEIRP